MAGWLDRPLLGPMSIRQVGRGLRDAIVTPILQDEQAMYEARHANPTMDLIASQHPAYGIPAAIQDIAHGGNAVMEGAGAIPIVKGLRGAYESAKELAKMGAKGKRAGENLFAGSLGVTAANSAARGEEIMNPGPMPNPYE